MVNDCNTSSDGKNYGIPHLQHQRDDDGSSDDKDGNEHEEHSGLDIAP